MNSKVAPRPGGRSARVQSAVHEAVRELDERVGRSELTVPLIAARAGVTPSTIYRRWGDLSALLADVAVARLRAEGEPLATGTVTGDLQAWAEQYLEEMTSEVGLAMMRDVLTSSQRDQLPCRCAEFTASQIECILERAARLGQPVPAVDSVMDVVVAPIIYRALFGQRPPSLAEVRRLVERCLLEPRAQGLTQKLGINRD